MVQIKIVMNMFNNLKIISNIKLKNTESEQLINKGNKSCYIIKLILL